VTADLFYVGPEQAEGSDVIPGEERKNLETYLTRVECNAGLEKGLLSERYDSVTGSRKKHIELSEHPLATVHIAMFRAPHEEGQIGGLLPSTEERPRQNRKRGLV